MRNLLTGIYFNNKRLYEKAKLLRGWGRSSTLFNEDEGIKKRFNTKVDGIPYDGLTDRLNSYSFDYFFAPINGRDWFRKSQGIIGNLSSRELAELCSEKHVFGVISFS